MMKRTLFLLSLILIVTGSMWAQKSFRVGDFAYIVTNEENKEVEVYIMDSTLTSVDIPATVVDGKDERYSVVGVGAYAFANSKFLTQVNIPNSVKSIGKGAFYNCKSLAQITLPNSVTSIEASAFGGCESLKQIHIPNSVKSIGKLAFSRCASLTYVTFPSSVEYFGDGVFGINSNVKKMTVNAIVPPNINDAAFSLCPSTMQVYVPAKALEAYKVAEGWKKLNLNAIRPENKTVRRDVGFSFY